MDEEQAPLQRRHPRDFDTPDTDPPFEVREHKFEPQVRSVRPFVGRLASGRGRVVHSDDASFTVEANPPLTAPEQALAVKYGFDDESPEQDGSLFIGEKSTVREVGGDVNHLARIVTGRQGRGR